MHSKVFRVYQTQPGKVSDTLSLQKAGGRATSISATSKDTACTARYSGFTRRNRARSLTLLVCKKQEDEQHPYQQQVKTLHAQPDTQGLPDATEQGL